MGLRCAEVDNCQDCEATGGSTERNHELMRDLLVKDYEVVERGRLGHECCMNRFVARLNSHIVDFEWRLSSS